MLSRFICPVTRPTTFSRRLFGASQDSAQGDWKTHLSSLYYGFSIVGIFGTVVWGIIGYQLDSVLKESKSEFASIKADSDRKFAEIKADSARKFAELKSD